MSTLACEGSGSAPAAPQRLEGYRAKTPTHKVQVTQKVAFELEQRGTRAKVLADYGAFKLLEVDDKALESLPAVPGVELRDEYNHILLNAGAIDTTTEHAQSLRGMKKLSHGKGLHLVQFAGPIQPEWLQALEATGVRVVTYIPNNAYLVYGDAPQFSNLQRHIDEDGARAIQWNADYLDDYKLDPSVWTAQTDAYSVQLVKDEAANAATLALVRQLQAGEPVVSEALGYVNVVVPMTRDNVFNLVNRPDVVSIQPRPTPRKRDERQNMIVSGNLTAGGGVTGPGYLAWLASKGFTQAQFTASGFGVDVSDSGVDNGLPQTPNHFGLYTGGNVANASRMVYNRLEGTPNGAGSTIQGCDGHGNINSHIIGGYVNLTGAPHADTAGFNYGLGVAPFVKMGSSVVFDPGTFTSPNYENLQARAYRDGMRISSNSWGSNANTYTTDSQRYDALVRDAQPTGSAVPNPGNQEMVILFAAGNRGPNANTVGSPGSGKNVITVGASENVHAFGGADACSTTDSDANNAMDIVGFSSRGPTSDGRKKPDIMAPGTHVSGGVAQADGQRSPTPGAPLGQALSCFNATGVCAGFNSNYHPAGQQWTTASSGTSHSTPALAGGAALVRQYFINQGVVPPSPAMTKAYLMNSARYMTGGGANDNLYSNNQGMGLMDLGMAFDGVARKLDDQTEANLFTATGQSRTFEGKVGDPTKPFRVTLAWTDAPGSTTGSAWRNNLDLVVTVGGNSYRGNVFTKGLSVTGGTADGSNNVESVFLPEGTTGSFTLTVAATNINSDGVPGNATAVDQDFALVVYNSCSDTTSALDSVTATATGDNLVEVSWSANDATSYNVYRSTTAGGPYARVGTVAAPPFVDTTVSGGTTYFYTVRPTICVEAPASNEASATATGACTLSPSFAGLASAGSANVATCGTTLSWAAGTATCGGTLSYSVYRGTTAGFTPSVANRIATGISGLSYADDANLTSGTAYYYVVRATETAAASVEETNTVEKSTVPTGPVTLARFFDDFDGNRPANASAYWVPTATTGSAATMNVVSGCRFQSATRAYRFGAANTTCGGTYPISTTGFLSLGGNGSVAGINGLTIAPIAAPRMTFNVWYNFELRYDGAWLVYSTTGASGPWINVSDAVSTTAPYISAGGYDNTLNSASTTRIWTGNTGGLGSNGALKAVTVNLTPLAGQKVWFAFRVHSDITGVAEGFYVDEVRLDADIPIPEVCSTNVPPPGPAVSYRVTGLPASVKAGTDATFTVTAMDAVGQTATGYSGSASFSSTDRQAVLPTDAAFTEGVASGVVTSFRTLGAQSITARDTQDPAVTGSASTSVTAGDAVALVFTVPPSNTTAGSAITPAVRVGLVDQFGNAVSTGTQSVTLALAGNPTGDTLAGTTTATMVAGVATFSNLSLTKVGVGYTLTASADGLTGATSPGFNIRPAAPAKLAFSVQPSNGNAGVALNPAVQVSILDTYGNLTSASDKVGIALSNNPEGGTLLGTVTAGAVDGVATFNNLALDKVATGYTLTATSGSLANISSAPFDIGPGAPYRVSITRQPIDVRAGAPLTPSVEATLLDKFGNVATQASNLVSIAIANNPGAIRLGGTSRVNAIAGVATFGDLTLARAGLNYTLVVGTSGLFGDTSAGFDVLVGAPAQLAFSASPPARTASGAAFSASVAVRDIGGDLNTDMPVDVTVSLTNAAGATLGGTTTVTSVNGVATFTDLSVDKAGTGYTLTASAAGVQAATSGAFAIGAGAPAALAFTVQPSNIVAGAAITPAVQVSIQDAQGNTVTSASDSITLALESNASGGALRGTATVAAVNGVATFTGLTVNKKGTGYRLTASSGALTAATSSAFDAHTGRASHLAFSHSPAHSKAGENLGTIAVEIRDEQGNLVDDDTSSITLSLHGGQGGALAGTTTVAAVGGVATFHGLSIGRASAGYNLAAHVDGLMDASSLAFNISHGAAAALSFVVQPGAAQAGTAIGPMVRVAIVDAFGNVVTDSSAPVTLALDSNPGEGTLSGTMTVNAINGVATFTNVSLNRVAKGYTLQASTGALTSAKSSTFDVSAGAASKLVFRDVAGAFAAHNTLGAIVVELHDAEGNLLTDSNANVTLGLGENAAGGMLLGSTTVAAVKGVATFEGLSLRKAGNGYALVATAQGFAGAASAAFSVTSGPAKRLSLTLPPSVTAGQEVVLSATAHDAYGNVAGYGGAAKVASSDTAAVLPATAKFVEGESKDLKVTFKGSGLRTLTLTDATEASLSGSAQTNVTPFAQPKVSVINPANGSTVSGEASITVKGEVAPGTKVKQIVILVDGAVIATGSQLSVTGAWDSTQTENDSKHTITAVITDEAGNVATSAPLGVVTNNGSCGCAATSGADAGFYMGLLVLARYVAVRRRRNAKAA